MAAFASTTAAEDRAKAKTLDGTWGNAHVEKTETAAIAVRVQRKMSAAAPTAGGWVSITDDAIV